MYNRRLVSGLAVASGAAAAGYAWLEHQRSAHASTSKFEPAMLSSQQINQRLGQSQVTQHVQVDGLPIRHVSFAQFAANKQIEDTYQELYFEAAGNFRPRKAPDTTPAWMRVARGLGEWVPFLGSTKVPPAAADDEEVSSGLPAPPPSQHLLVGVFDGHSGKHASHWLKNYLYDVLLYRWHQAAQSSPDALGHGPLWSPQAFVEADNLFLDLKWRQNKVRHGLSGACYAVSHITKGAIRVANGGDCRVVLGRLRRSPAEAGADTDADAEGLEPAYIACHPGNLSCQLQLLGNAQLQLQQRRRAKNHSPTPEATPNTSGTTTTTTAPAEPTGIRESLRQMWGRLVGQGSPEAGAGGSASRASHSYEALNLSVDHTIRYSPAERARLITEHPTEDDVDRRNRIKGHLEPTRGMGDGAYKRMEYFQAHPRRSKQHKEWHPPYSTAHPDIYHHPLGPRDDFLVLASDGLYDFLSSQEVVDTVHLWLRAQDEATAPPELAERFAGLNASGALVRAALEKASYLRFPQLASPDDRLSHLLALPPQSRRSYYDDTSVAVVFFDTERAPVVGPPLGFESPEAAAASAAAPPATYLGLHQMVEPSVLGQVNLQQDLPVPDPIRICGDPEPPASLVLTGDSEYEVPALIPTRSW